VVHGEPNTHRNEQERARGREGRYLARELITVEERERALFVYL
jgi:hypothetical protein